MIGNKLKQANELPFVEMIQAEAQVISQWYASGEKHSVLTASIAIIAIGVINGGQRDFAGLFVKENALKRAASTLFF